MADPSEIALGIKSPDIGGGAVGLLSKLAPAVNAMNQNKLFNQEFEAKKALGPLAQQSVDPTTGAIDWKKFSNLISTDPKTAFIAPGILQQIETKNLTQLQEKNAELEMGLKTRGVLLGAGNALLAKYKGKENTLPADALGKSLTDMQAQFKALGIENQWTDPKGQLEWLAQYKDPNGSLLSGRALYDKLDQQLLTQQEAQKQAEMVKGQIQIHEGQSMDQILNTNPYRGTVDQLGQIAHTLTWAEKVAQIKLLQPGGGEGQVSQGSIPGAGPGTNTLLDNSGRPSASVGGAPPEALGGPPPNALTGPPAAPSGPGTNSLVSSPPPGNFSGRSPSVIEQKGMEQVTKANDDLHTTVDQEQRVLNYVDQATEQFKKIHAGGGAETRTAIGEKIQAAAHAAADLGWTNVAAKLSKAQEAVANGSLPASQAATMFSLAEVIRQLSVAAKGQGQIRSPEVNAWLDNMVDLDKDPEASRSYFNAFKQIYRNDRARQDFTSDFIKKASKRGSDTNWSDYPSMLSRHLEDSGVVNPKDIPAGLFGSEVNGAPGPRRSLDEIFK